MSDAFCERVSKTFGDHAIALRPVAVFLRREACNPTLAALVERIIQECTEGACATYEETPPHGTPITGRWPAQEQ